MGKRLCLWEGNPKIDRVTVRRPEGSPHRSRTTHTSLFGGPKGRLIGMAGTYVKARFHFVWSTRSRQPWLTTPIRPRLWGYFNRVIQDHGGILFEAGGVSDHVHLYLECPTTLAIAELASIVKTTSSKWLRQTFDDCKGFHWQSGYAAFSVNPADDEGLRHYIRNQETHHTEHRFEDEYRRFLEENRMNYEERYLFD